MTTKMTIEYLQKLTGMEEHDASNLFFILNCSAAVLKDWYSKMEEDDHTYALELLGILREALNARELEEKLNKECSLKEANEYLKKFMLQ